MSLAPYARRVARVEVPDVLRWPDIPVGANRQVSVDVSAWAAQVTGDDPASVTAAVLPADGGLAISGQAVSGNVAGLTIEAEAAGAGTDYAVTLTVTSEGGRVEPYTVRVLVTDPTA
jgi:hypothetical protein